VTCFLRRAAIAAVLLTVPMGSATAEASSPDSGAAFRAVTVAANTASAAERFWPARTSAPAVEAIAAAALEQVNVAGADAAVAQRDAAAAAAPVAPARTATAKPQGMVATKAAAHAVATRRPITSPKRRTRPSTRPSTPPTTRPTTPPATPPVGTAPKPVVVPPSSGLAALENEVISLTNVQRTANGCKAVAAEGRLTIAARGHSADMIAKNYFSHVSPSGGTFTSRASAAGYSAAMSENIAWGWPTAEKVVSEWMNSAGHRANILNCSAVVVGVGAAKKADGTIYWTQVFGRS